MAGLLKGLMVDLPCAMFGMVGKATAGAVTLAATGTMVVAETVQERRVLEAARAQAARPVLPPAGWYVDAYDDGLLRWWTGQAWTALVTPNGARRRYAPPVLPPAGWYRDKDDSAMLQWFDGREWTGIVRSASEQFEDVPEDGDEATPYDGNDIAEAFDAYSRGQRGESMQVRGE